MRLLMLVMLASAVAACTPARVVTRTIERTRTQYVPLDPGLLPAVLAPYGGPLQTNGDLLRAYAHDSAELGKCQPALDGIRRLQPRG